MKNAFGGVFMIRLLLVFIVIYVSFAAVSLNYAKAFRIKNKVISFIEENGIDNLKYFENTSNLTKLDAILENADYTISCVKNGLQDTEIGDPKSYCYKGVIISELPSTGNAKYFEISTFAAWNMGNLSLLMRLGGEEGKADQVENGSFTITGKAKVVTRE